MLVLKLLCNVSLLLFFGLYARMTSLLWTVVLLLLLSSSQLAKQIMLSMHSNKGLSRHLPRSLYIQGFLSWAFASLKWLLMLRRSRPQLTIEQAKQTNPTKSDCNLS